MFIPGEYKFWFCIDQWQKNPKTTTNKQTKKIIIIKNQNIPPFHRMSKEIYKSVKNYIVQDFMCCNQTKNESP